MRRQIAGLYGLLIVFNVAVWLWAFVALAWSSSLMGMAMLAYSFGLRHALDADHIAAIDNVTRKSMQAGKRPVTVGLAFSLGHSSVVVLATVFAAAATTALSPRFASFASLGNVVGPLISTVFLFAVALTNSLALASLARTYLRVKRHGETQAPEPVRVSSAATRGWTGCLRQAFALVAKPWHMYLLGFLFGLGFDTATEVSLLSLSASQAAHGMPIGAILVFPALFTAAMTLVDFTDGLLMVGAYGWAFVDPARKLVYNMTVTGISVAAAAVIASIEGMQWLAGAFQWRGEAWRFVDRLTDEFSVTGGVIVMIFVMAWLAAIVFQRRRQSDLLARDLS